MICEGGRKGGREGSGGGLLVRENGREDDFLSSPLSCRVGGFGLSVFSKGRRRGANWRHIRVKLMKREG